jgi:hypothetical protein
MAEYPVMFTFQDVVSGNGFLAGINLCGRALICKEADDAWWTYGIHPGGIAETGKSALESFATFRNSYKNALFDISEEAANFEAFKIEVERFFHETAADAQERWVAAIQAIRTGQVTPEEPFSTLPRQSPDERPERVEIKRLDKIESNKFSSLLNVSDKLELPIAA